MKARKTKAENLADLAPTPVASAAASVQSQDPRCLRGGERLLRKWTWEQVALIKKGGFDKLTALRALSGYDLHAMDRVALWLRGELNKLRDSKRATLPRVEIADLAITMLEQLTEADRLGRAATFLRKIGIEIGFVEGFHGIGENLLSLLRELLEVDRHRKKIAPNEKLRWAAAIDGMALENGEFLGVRELARRVGVRPRAIVDWRRSATYHKEISMGLGSSQREVAAFFASLSKK